MALIQCPECGQKVSDRAEECPKCGYPLHEHEEEAGSPAATTTISVVPTSAPTLAPVSAEGASTLPKTAEGLTETPASPKATPPAHKESAPEAKPAAKEKQKDKGLLPYIIGVIVLVLMTGAGLWWIIFQEPADTAPAKTTTSAARTGTPVSTTGPTSNTPQKQTYTANGVEFKMVQVEGSTFTMGATSEQTNPYSNEKPTHRVTLSTFSIGETEVTQALWHAVMGDNPSHFRGDNLPVENVSWEDCQVFLQKLNTLTGQRFRLPTEAEWEYAARGGQESRSYRYSGSDRPGDVAWNGDNSNERTHPVGTKLANELGLYDMSGNVWEWCQDWRDSYSSEAQTNPRGPASGTGRVCRGGGWDSSDRDIRVSLRGSNSPTKCGDGLGLRLAQ